MWKRCNGWNDRKMLLAVDIGNSKIAIGIFKDAELIERWRVATISKRTADEYAILLPP